MQNLFRWRIGRHSDSSICTRLVVDLGGAQCDSEDVLVVAILVLHEDKNIIYYI